MILWVLLMSYSDNKYSEISIHPHAHEMLHRISNATYIHMTHLVGMYIANEACLLDSIGRNAYLEQFETKFDEAEEMLVYFEPSDSKKYTGKLRVYQTYLAKLREVAWSINVRPKDFITYVISAEYAIIEDLNKESNEAGIGQYLGRLVEYRKLIDRILGPPTTYIYKSRRQSGFVPANKLKKQGGDSLL